MIRDVETVRKLWRGESVAPAVGRDEIDVRIATSVQPELPVWITAAGPRRRFAVRRNGCGVFAHLLGHSLRS